MTGGWPAPIASYTPVMMFPFYTLNPSEKIAFISPAVVSPLSFGVTQCAGIFAITQSGFLIPSTEETSAITSEINPTIISDYQEADLILDAMNSLRLSTVLESADALISLLQNAGGHCMHILSGDIPFYEFNVPALHLYHRLSWLRSLVINSNAFSSKHFVSLIGPDLHSIMSIAALDPLPSILLTFDVDSHKGTHAQADVLRSLVRNVDSVFLNRLSLRLWKQLKTPRQGHFGSTAQFIVLAGEVQISLEGGTVKALSAFPSIRLTSHAFLKRTGRYYYEVEIMTEGLVQIGFADASFRCDPTSGQGVGDHLHSWAFDGMRTKKWNVACDSYGKRWRIGDVVGALIDMDLLEMRFYLNGEDLGQAFVNFTANQPIFPALSLNVRQTVRVNIGHTRFM